jgi:hypothetical protein
MPTTTIETPLTDARFERRVAKELSFWWRRQGTDIRHVLTRFVTLAGDRLYSGPLPMSTVGDRPFAVVSCVVSHHRDEGFKRAYARQVREVLAPEVPADRVFVSFRPTDPDDHFAPGSTAWNDQEEVPS